MTESKSEKADISSKKGPDPSSDKHPQSTLAPPPDSVTDEEFEEFDVESEPYLGPAWAVVMFVLYLLKEAFPAEQYTTLWWFQIYIIVLVIAITVFTLLKRHQYYKQEKKRDADDTAS